MTKPTIARVQGAAFGGGVGLVACCDIAVARRTAAVLAVRGAAGADSRGDQPLCHRAPSASATRGAIS